MPDLVVGRSKPRWTRTGESFVLRKQVQFGATKAGKPKFIKPGSKPPEFMLITPRTIMKWWARRYIVPRADVISGLRAPPQAKAKTSGEGQGDAA